MKKTIFLLATLLATLGMAQTPQYPMPKNAVFDSDPSQPGSPIHQVLTYAIDADSNGVPVKLFKITNNADFTVYPILRDGNEKGGQIYDPYDPLQTEYRGYIGYKGADGKYYFGLQKDETIAIRIPLVFWNAARMGIVTNGQYLTPAAGAPNPLNYKDNAQCVIVAAEKDSGGIQNEIVMWYKGPIGAPALDSPDQLVEWTIRDSAYLSSAAILKRANIPESERTTLINYDVSYVDNMFLPVAMEALDVTVPAPPYPPGKNPAPYGWIGSTKTAKELKSHITDFTAYENNQLLGAYFGGKGWPFYNIPLDPNSGVKIPSAVNVFGQSPLSSVLSSYDNNRFMLSSSDTGAIMAASIGTAQKASKGDLNIPLAPGEPLSKVKSLKPGQLVVGHVPTGQTNPVQEGTTVVIFHVSTGNGDPSIVQLSKALLATDKNCTLDFINPVSDYASNAMIKLWYSWANYYLEQTKDIKQLDIKGAVKENEATLRFGDAVNGLTEGMQVTGPGLENPDPNKGKGGVFILSIASDKKSVTLSNLATENHDNQDYHFIRPQPLPVTPENLYTFQFSDAELKDSARLPAAFSQKVYLTMAAMAQIPKKPDPNVKTPHVLQLMYNIVGGTMGFMFDTDAKRFTPDGLAISATVRDMIKSVLRGVSDFTAFPESTGAWYPDPKIPHGGLKFNAFNLDPFVWFVHVQLGFSGYGFSLDDDTADVGAGQATQLQISIGGENGLTNPNEWTIQAVYGPVPGLGNWDPDTTMSFYLGISNATNTNPIVVTSNKHGLTTGETVTIDQVEGNTGANGKHKIVVISDSTFILLGSTTSKNNYKAGTGRWTLGPLPFISDVDSLSVYWKLKGDDGNAGFQGALVEIPGMVNKGPFRVKQLGNDKLGILALNKAPRRLDGTPLPKGKYKWTFSGK